MADERHVIETLAGPRIFRVARASPCTWHAAAATARVAGISELHRQPAEELRSREVAASGSVRLRAPRGRRGGSAALRGPPQRRGRRHRGDVAIRCGTAAGGAGLRRPGRLAAVPLSQQQYHRLRPSTRRPRCTPGTPETLGVSPLFCKGVSFLYSAYMRWQIRAMTEGQGLISKPGSLRSSSSTRASAMLMRLGTPAR